MAQSRNQLLDLATYLALRTVSMALHCFPVNMNLKTAQWIGSAMYRFDRKHRERALANLRRSYPNMPETRRREMARRSMQHLVMLGVEVLFTTRLIKIDTWRRYIELHNLQEALDLLVRGRTPLVMVTGHYSNWELLGYVLATLGFESIGVARPLDNSYINEWLLGVRQKQGHRILDKKGATIEVGKALAAGGTVGFIADQNAGSKGMFVEFLGRQASTYKSIGLLAMQNNCPVIVGYARRIGEQFRFEIGVQDIIYPRDWEDQPDPLRYITQRYTKGIEDFVTADPGQYLWVHRRWKTRPKGEAPEPQD